MSFVYPSFLWALAFLAVPILIHLFHFRRFKTVYFSNVRFLREVKEQTSSRSRLKHLLILLMRLLVVAALVLAFAQPFIPSEQGGLTVGQRAVSIFIDNSFSMAAESEDVPLIEKARTRAEEIIMAYAPDDVFQILTTDFEGRDQRLLSRDDALARLREVQASYAVQPLSKVMQRQQKILQSSSAPNKIAYLISDFQRNITDIQAPLDTLIELNFIPLQSVQSQNVAIDTAWFTAPVQSLNQTSNLIVKIHNYSEQEASNNLRLSLQLNGQSRPEGKLSIPPQSSVYDTVNLTVLKTGWQQGKLSITDYPIEFDNDYYFSFYVKPNFQILEVYEEQPNRFVQASFSPNDYFQSSSQQVKQLDYASLAQRDLIVLSELRSISSGLASELKQYVNNGGKLLVFPHPEADLASYNRLLQGLQANTFSKMSNQARQVSYINMQSAIFRDVFEKKEENIKLPSSLRNYPIGRSARAQEEVLLRYRDGGTFLAKYNMGKGLVFLCSAPLNLDFANFVEQGEIFVPLLYKATVAQGFSRKIAYTIGTDKVLETDNRSSSSEMVYKMQGPAGEFIPEQRALGARVVLNVNQGLNLAGFYTLYLEENKVLDNFAFNFDRMESDLRFWNETDLRQRLGEEANIIAGTYVQDFKSIIDEQRKGTPLWKWCLMASLLFLFMETLLLRLWPV